MPGDVAGIAIFGVFLFLTYYLQTVKGYSPVTSGLPFLPLVACILLSSNASSIVLLPRPGPRALISLGMLLGGGSMVSLVAPCVLGLRRQRAARAPGARYGHGHGLRAGHQYPPPPASAGRTRGSPQRW